MLSQDFEWSGLGWVSDVGSFVDWSSWGLWLRIFRQPGSSDWVRAWNDFESHHHLLEQKGRMVYDSNRICELRWLLILLLIAREFPGEPLRLLPHFKLLPHWENRYHSISYKSTRGFQYPLQVYESLCAMFIITKYRYEQHPSISRYLKHNGSSASSAFLLFQLGKIFSLLYVCCLRRMCASTLKS